MRKFLQAARIGFRLVSYKLAGKRCPLVANILLTNRCNLKCFYCYAQVFNRDLDDIEPDKWLGVIDKLHGMGTEIIVLLGGEPLLYKGVDKIIKRIKGHGMICELITNGYFVENNIDILRQLDSVCLSIDGDDAANDRNRGKGSYQKAVKAMDILKDSGVQTRIKAVITRNNIKSLEYLCHLALDHNVKLTFTFPCIHADTEDLKISAENIKSLMKDAERYKKSGYPIAYTLTCLRYMLRWQHDYYQWIGASAKVSHRSIRPCIKNDLSCYIDADGMMYPCAILWSDFPGRKNIFEEGIKNAWDTLAEKPCYACGYISEVEFNLLFSLSFHSVMESFLYFLRGRK